MESKDRASGRRISLYEAFPQAKKEEDKVAENLEELEKAWSRLKTNYAT